MPEAKTEFTTEEARRYGAEIGIDWSTAPFDFEQFRNGMNVELEHGLHEFADYYTRLEQMEEEAKRYWDQRQ